MQVVVLQKHNHFGGCPCRRVPAAVDPSGDAKNVTVRVGSGNLLLPNSDRGNSAGRRSSQPITETAECSAFSSLFHKDSVLKTSTLETANRVSQRRLGLVAVLFAIMLWAVAANLISSLLACIAVEDIVRT